METLVILMAGISVMYGLFLVPHAEAIGTYFCVRKAYLKHHTNIEWKQNVKCLSDTDRQNLFPGMSIWIIVDNYYRLFIIIMYTIGVFITNNLGIWVSIFVLHLLIIDFIRNYVVPKFTSLVIIRRTMLIQIVTTTLIWMGTNVLYYYGYL